MCSWFPKIFDYIKLWFVCFCTNKQLDSLVNDCNSTYPYRLSNGACNNLMHKWWGRANTHFRRFAKQAYGDGVGTPRTISSQNGQALPNARSLAQKILPPNPQNSPLSQVFTYFGQFVAHDILRAAFGTVECLCGNPTRDPLCFNIPIPATETDPAMKSQSCIPLKRDLDSKTAAMCNLGHRQQFNIRTHWLDSDNIYGVSDADAADLRSMQNGLLKSSVLPNSDFEGLNIADMTRCLNPPASTNYGCFITGDDRAETNIYLTSMHTVII